MVDKQDYIDGIDAVKDMIAHDNSAVDGHAAGELRQVILLGHVVVPYSGLTTNGGHEPSAAPTDLYYADLDGTPVTWGDDLTLVTSGNDGAHEATTNEEGDARFDVTNVPTDGDDDRVEVGIGRIDMANLDAAFPDVFDTNATQFESDLINQYLQRNHDWRMGSWTTSGALVDPISDRDGEDDDLVDALGSLVGSGNVVHDDERTWLSEFAEVDPPRYLVASAAYRGDYDAVANVFDPPIRFPQFTSYHFEDLAVRGVFTTVYGSYMSDWNNRSLRNFVDVANFTDEEGNGTFPTEAGHLIKAGILRSMLGAEGDGLVSTLWSGTSFRAPAGWFEGDTPLALGYPVGEGFRYGVNNFSSGYVQDELLGDPTLRMAYVKPVTAVQESIDLSTGYATISWTPPSGETIARYEVYQSDSLDGTFTLVNSTTNSILTDTSPAGEYVYMVRAIRVDNSGLANQYDNASAGVFASQVVLQGGTGAQTIYIKRTISGSADTLSVWDNGTGSGSADYALDGRITESITFNGEAGDDTLTIDHAGTASPVPSAGIDFNPSTGTGDTLKIIGTSGANTVTFSSNTVTMGGATTYDSNLEHLQFDGKLGDDIVNITSTNTLEVVFPTSQEFQSLTIASGKRASMSLDGTNVLVISDTLNLNSGSSPKGTLDLNDNDMIVQGGSYAAISSLISSARAAGAWSGSGLTSSAAAAIRHGTTTLGLLKGSEYNAIYNPDEFHGYSISSGDALLKYTYYGDTELNGVVDYDDYSRSGTGFNNNYSGWLNGDFDYSGTVDFDDLSLQDNAFYNQGGTLRPGEGGDPLLIELGQMEHFTESYMNFFIDWNEEREIYYTVEDFFPDGAPW